MSRIWIIEKKEPPPYGRTVWAWVDYNKAGVHIKGWYLAKRIETGMADDYETVNPFTFKTDIFSREHVKLWSPFHGLTEPPVLDDIIE